MQITQPILPSKIYAPAGIALAKQSVSNDVGVTGLVPLVWGGLGVGLSTVGGSGIVGGSVMYNMGAPSALTGLEAVPQDHTIQGMCRCGPYMRRLAIATGKPGVASTIWVSNEAKTAFSVLAAPEDMVKFGGPLTVQNLAEYRPFAGANAGSYIFFSALVNDDDDYALPGYVNIYTGAVTVAGLSDLPGNAGGTQAACVRSARFACLGDALLGGFLAGVPAIATLETKLQIQRSPDASFAGPFNQVMSVYLGTCGHVASWSIEAFSGYLGGTNCLLLMATGLGGASYLYRSTDKGLTWRPGASFPVSATGGRGHIHWISNLEVIMAIGRILYHSRDGGGSWRKIADVGDEVTALTGMEDGSIYAGTQNGVVHRFAPLYW